jgi:hypothetical protein
MTLILLAFLTPVLLYGIADLKPELKARNIRLVIIYLTMSVCSLALCFCVLRSMPLKSPSDIVTSIVKSLFPPLG